MGGWLESLELRGAVLLFVRILDCEDHSMCWGENPVGEMMGTFVVLNMCYIMCYAVGKCSYVYESVRLLELACVQSHDKACVKTRKDVCKDTKDLCLCVKSRKSLTVCVKSRNISHGV